MSDSVNPSQRLSFASHEAFEYMVTSSGVGVETCLDSLPEELDDEEPSELDPEALLDEADDLSSAVVFAMIKGSDIILPHLLKSLSSPCKASNSASIRLMILCFSGLQPRRRSPSDLLLTFDVLSGAQICLQTAFAHR